MLPLNFKKHSGVILCMHVFAYVHTSKTKDKEESIYSISCYNDSDAALLYILCKYWYILKNLFVSFCVMAIFSDVIFVLALVLYSCI